MNNTIESVNAALGSRVFGTETDTRRHPDRIEYLAGRLRCRLALVTEAWETYALIREENPAAAVELRVDIARPAELEAGEILAELRGIMGGKAFEQWCEWLQIDGFCHCRATALIEQFLESLSATPADPVRNRILAKLTKEAA